MKLTEMLKNGTRMRIERVQARSEDDAMLTGRKFLKIALVSATTISLGLQVGCDGDDESDDDIPIEFELISDAHLYDTKLGTTGAAFEEYLATDPKHLRESEAILKSAVDSIKSTSAQFVLICGDMTKDGERDCHELMASYLAQLRAAGKTVYVVPGNHDVDNPEAYSYSGSTQTPVSNVTPEEFTDIYWDYGYSAAIARDPNSLSYVAEPADGYWLLAIDSCIYKNNTSGKLNTAGVFSDQTLDWIRARLAEASQRDKTVLGLMHHGLVEHFTGQATFFPGFVINDWENLSTILAQDGLRFVFTGHFHATDCTERTWTDTGVQLYDIETGSPVSSPCACRQVRIESGVMDIDTIRITNIDYDTGSGDFPGIRTGLCAAERPKHVRGHVHVPALQHDPGRSRGVRADLHEHLAGPLWRRRVARRLDPIRYPDPSGQFGPLGH